MKKVILILVVIAGIAGGCKKYEDGPLLSFRSAKSRLFGEHTLVKYTVNDIDSLNLFNDSLGLDFRFYYDDVNSLNVLNVEGNRKDGNYYPVICTWQLEKNNTILKILTEYAYTGTGPFGNNITPDWEILKLKHHDIIMKTTYNGKEYLIELK